MEHLDTWPAIPNGERRSARLLAALVVSVLCHATVLLGVRGWRLEARPVPPLVVTMLERGGGDAQAGAGEGTAVGPEQAAVVVPPAPMIAPPPPSRPAPVRRAARAPSPRAVAAAKPSHDAVAPADTAAPTSATTVAATGGDGGTGAARGGSDGSGHGHRGSGGGTGTGSDGLRAFCASCPVPEYPGRARRQGWQGTVDVELAIGRDGAVAEARVGRSSGYPALDEVALGVARRSRFTVPATGAGLRGQLRYRFVLDETAARR